MKLSKVRFVVNHENYPYPFDRSRLKLGATVFVVFDDTGTPRDFYPDFTPSSVAYSVEWIAPSEWSVILQDKFNLDIAFQERVTKAVETYLDKETVIKGLSISTQDIRPEYMFKTSEFNKSRLAVISTVVEHLDLCSKLSDTTTAKLLFHHYRPLVVYLLLTCFDRLGQPSDWMGFDSWLRASDKEKEREQVVFEKTDTETEIALALYDVYNKIYGVSRSFCRFIDEIIPDRLRQELLDSISIEIVDNPPNIGNNRKGDNNAKKKYLFKLRNDYTHKAQFVPGITKELWPEGTIDKNIWEMFEQSIEQTNWKTIFVRNWPYMLEKVVRAGLAIYIEKIAWKEVCFKCA